jgi:DNA polymerase III alpha subunit (gram-positive type)
MRLLFIDFETQSEDAQTTNPIEVGVTMISDFSKVFLQQRSESHLIWDSNYPTQTKENIEITGITDQMLQKEGKSCRIVFEHGIIPLVQDVDYVMAHNKYFDETVFRQVCDRLGLNIPDTPWICTLHDLPWPKKYRCKKLAHLAFDHGVISDPTKLHRAQYDTELLAELITSKYNIYELIEYAMKPWVYIKALIPKPWEDNGVGKNQAKKLGFYWQQLPGESVEFTGSWVKRVKEDELPHIKATYPFKVVRLERG